MAPADPAQAATSTGAAGAPPAAAKFPSGQQVYDAIMGRIEPDLVSANLENLPAKHAAETEEARKARLARYGQAFARYDAEYATFVTDAQGIVEAARKQALKDAEAHYRKEESGTLAELEAEFAVDAVPPTPPSSAPIPRAA